VEYSAAGPRCNSRLQVQVVHFTLSVSVQGEVERVPTLESFITPEIAPQAPLFERLWLKCHFIVPVLLSGVDSEIASEFTLQVARSVHLHSESLVIRLVVWSRHDWKPGKQLPGASIAGEPEERSGSLASGAVAAVVRLGTPQLVLASTYLYSPSALLITIRLGGASRSRSPGPAGASSASESCTLSGWAASSWALSSESLSEGRASGPSLLDEN
jgi:hypothetical protein